MSTSPTQRTIRALRDQGRVCGIVERWNQHVGAHGVRQDLFGIIDIIALDPERGVVGIQSCGQDFAAHIRKLTEERSQESYDWLSTPGTALEVWGWRKVKLKRGGVAMRWQPRVQEITLADLGGFSEGEEDMLSVQTSVPSVTMGEMPYERDSTAPQPDAGVGPSPGGVAPVDPTGRWG